MTIETTTRARSCLLLSTGARKPLALAFAFALVGGCAAAAPEPTPSTEDAKSRDDRVESCGDYQAKECDPNEVFDYITSHGLATTEGVFGCAECVEGLAAAGIIAVDEGPAAVLLNPWNLFHFIGGDLACIECVDFVQESGIAHAVDCALEPCQYDPAVRDQECQQICAPRLGFVAQGSDACICTDSQAERDCRVTCDEEHPINAECWCEELPPPPPPPECGDGSDGYSCSSDPDSGVDRACCGGTCVVWECSACDSGNPYCGQ